MAAFLDDSEPFESVLITDFPEDELASFPDDATVWFDAVTPTDILPGSGAGFEALVAYQKQLFSQIEVTNVFLFHIEVLLVFILGGFIFSLVYRIIKNNVTNHFT